MWVWARCWRARWACTLSAPVETQSHAFCMMRCCPLPWCLTPDHGIPRWVCQCWLWVDRMRCRSSLCNCWSARQHCHQPGIESGGMLHSDKHVCVHGTMCGPCPCMWTLLQQQLHVKAEACQHYQHASLGSFPFVHSSSNPSCDGLCWAPAGSADLDMTLQWWALPQHLIS